ncbi:MAG: hypothetical protein DCC75_01610 [Proteobacteria bacterium]|nr:MAG: hypothetical protein DCC75_01610 [Pseudomonadota bacterium]
MKGKKLIFDSLPFIDVYKGGIDFSLCLSNLARSVEDRVRYLMELQKLSAEAKKAGEILRKRR